MSFILQAISSDHRPSAEEKGLPATGFCDNRYAISSRTRIRLAAISSAATGFCDGHYGPRLEPESTWQPFFLRRNNSINNVE